MLTPHERDAENWGLLLRDDSVTTLEVQLVEGDGKALTLGERSFWGAMVSRSGTLPNRTDFSKLLMRSNRPLEISGVKWNCYNLEEVKR